MFFFALWLFFIFPVTMVTKPYICLNSIHGKWLLITFCELDVKKIISNLHIRFIKLFRSVITAKNINEICSFFLWQIKNTSFVDIFAYIVNWEVILSISIYYTLFLLLIVLILIGQQGPTWVLSASDGPHVGPMNLAIRVVSDLIGLVTHVVGIKLFA